EIRELVHHDFGDERSLRVARRAHRPLQAGVDEHVLVRAPPRVGRLRVVDVGQREACRRAGAPSAPRLGVECSNHPVGGHTRLDFFLPAAAGRFPATSCPPLRSSVSSPGGPACFASRAHISPSGPSCSLLPKPPPMYWQMTRTLVCGMPRPEAKLSRAEFTPC